VSDAVSSADCTAHTDCSVCILCTSLCPVGEVTAEAERRRLHPASLSCQASWSDHQGSLHASQGRVLSAAPPQQQSTWVVVLNRQSVLQTPAQYSIRSIRHQATDHAPSQQAFSPWGFPQSRRPKGLQVAYSLCISSSTIVSNISVVVCLTLAHLGPSTTQAWQPYHWRLVNCSRCCRGIT